MTPSFSPHFPRCAKVQVPPPVATFFILNFRPFPNFPPFREATPKSILSSKFDLLLCDWNRFTAPFPTAGRNLLDHVGSVLIVSWPDLFFFSSSAGELRAEKNIAGFPPPPKKTSPEVLEDPPAAKTEPKGRRLLLAANPRIYERWRTLNGTEREEAAAPKGKKIGQRIAGGPITQRQSELLLMDSGFWRGLKKSFGRVRRSG